MRITGVASNDYKYEQCQMPINIDEDLRFVVQFDEIDSLTNNSLSSNTCKHSQFCGSANSRNGGQNGYHNGQHGQTGGHTGHNGQNGHNGHNGTNNGHNSLGDSCYKTVSNQERNSGNSSPFAGDSGANHEGHDNNVKAPQGHHRTKNKHTFEENVDYPRKQFREHVKQYFKREDLLYVAKVNKTDLTSLLKRVVPCIGCRKSIEAMFDLLSKKGSKIPSEQQLELIKQQNNSDNLGKGDFGGAQNSKPDETTKSTVFTDVTFNRSHEFILTKSLRENDVEKFYDYLFMYGPRCIKIVEAMRTKKSNNRCWLHSLDARGTLDHKNKNLRNKKQNDDFMMDSDNNNYRSSSYLNDGSMVKSNVGSLGYFGMGTVVSREDLKDTWWNVWKMLPDHCKKELCCLDAKKLLGVVESYLERHSFCVDCKSQILKAYDKLCPKKFEQGDSNSHYLPRSDEHLYQSSHETDSNGEESEGDEEALEYTDIENDGKSSFSSLEREEALNSAEENEMDESDEELSNSKSKRGFMSKLNPPVSVKKRLNRKRKRKIRDNIKKMMENDKMDKGFMEPTYMEPAQMETTPVEQTQQRVPQGPQIDQNGNASYALPPDHPLFKHSAQNRQKAHHTSHYSQHHHHNGHGIDCHNHSDSDEDSSDDFSNTDITEEQFNELIKSKDDKERTIRDQRDRSNDDVEEINSVSTEDSSEFINQYNPLVYRGLRFCVGENAKKHLHVTTVIIVKV